MRHILAAALAIASIGSAAPKRISSDIRASGASAYVVIFPDADAAAHGRVALAQEGFDLLDHPDLRVTDVLIGGPGWKLESIAASDSVEDIIVASQDLLVRRRVHACAGPIDAPAGLAAAYSSGVRAWPPVGGVVALRLAFGALPAAMEPNSAKGEIERALREWERYGNFSVLADGAPGSLRTIDVRFVRGSHGDSYPFDGKSGMLAHTFYPAPPNAEPLAGDMHFDADESWGVGAGVDLFTVALHEAGHALGLGHSDQPGAVMYPYYRQAYALTSDDIAGIQSLYGARGAAPAPQPPSPPAPPTPPPVTPGPPPAVGPDRAAPTVKITSPTNTTVTTSAGAVTLVGTATDDTGVVAVRWSTSTGGAGDASGTTAWSASVPVYPGNTVITVRAYDAAGNSGWRTITVTRR